MSDDENLRREKNTQADAAANEVFLAESVAEDGRDATTQGDQDATRWLKFSRFTPWVGLIKMWGWLFAFALSISWRSLQESIVDIDDFRGLLLRLTWWVAGWIFLAMVLVSAISILIATLRWKHASYKFDSEGIHLRSGVVVKNRDHLRWDRVQAVDIRRSFFAKLARQGELVIDSGASGAQTTLILGLFPLQECEKLKQLILGVVDDVRQGKAPNFAAVSVQKVVDDRAFYRLSRTRLICGTAFSSAGIIGAVLFTMSVVVGLSSRGGLSVVALIALVLGPLFNIIQILNKNWNFTLHLVRDGLRKNSGLTSTDTVTILPDRIHSIKISQPPLWRCFDWWMLDVAVTGFDFEAQAHDAKRLRIIPVGTRDEVMRALWTILPDLGVEAADAFLSEGMGDERRCIFFRTAPRVSRWVDPYGYRRNGVALTNTVVAFRWGRVFNRNLRFFLHGRFQGLTLSTGPIQRRLGLASIRMDMATISFSTVQKNLSFEDALTFMSEEAQIGRRARAQRVAETITQWRERVGVDSADTTSAVDQTTHLSDQSLSAPHQTIDTEDGIYSQ